MHRVAYVAGTVDGGYLLWLLGGTHLHYGLDERQRGGLLLLRRMDAQQVHDLYLRVMSVRRQEMHCPVCRDRVATYGTQLRHRGGFADAYLGSQVADGWGEAHPDDVFHVDVVAKQPLFVVVDVDDAHQSVAVLSEIIQER